MARDYDKFKDALDEVPLDPRGKHKPDKLLAAIDAFVGIKTRNPDVEMARWYGLRSVASDISDKVFRLQQIGDNQKIPEARRMQLKEELTAEIIDIYEKSIALRLREDRGIMPKVPMSGGKPAVDAAKKVSVDMAGKAKAAAGGFVPRGR